MPSVGSEQLPFWEDKSLADMNQREWEALCDGCGRCCLNKLENEDTGEIFHTDVACRLLDLDTCQCSSYDDRKRYVPDCRKLTHLNLHRFSWLPTTCAYRLVAEKKKLFWWHPLISNSQETVHQAGISVRGKSVSERDTKDLENHIVSWPQ